MMPIVYIVLGIEVITVIIALIILLQSVQKGTKTKPLEPQGKTIAKSCKVESKTPNKRTHGVTNRVTCPDCGSDDIVSIYGKRFECKNCGRIFS